MNMLDMHTREQVNKIHIAEMHQETRNRHLLRGLSPTGITDSAKVRMRRVIVILIVVLFVGGFLTSVPVSF
jgi:hypothetical protein